MDPSIVYTDGACSDNQNNNCSRLDQGGTQQGFSDNDRWPEGAIGIWSPHGYEVSERLPHSLRPHTSPKAEYWAILQALRNSQAWAGGYGPIILYTDAEECVTTLNYRVRREWKDGIKADGQPAANWDIIKMIMQRLDQLRAHRSVNIIYIPGHAGYEGNEKADRLARDALRRALPQVQAQGSCASVRYAQAYY